jgi:hypothetical protein
MKHGILADDGVTIVAEFTVPMTVRSNHPVFVSDALSLKRSAVIRSPQRWEIETKLNPQSLTANGLMAQMVGKGLTKTFEIIMPQNIGAFHNTTARGAVEVAPDQSSTVVDGRTVTFGKVGSSKIRIIGPAGDRIAAGTFVRFATYDAGSEVVDGQSVSFTPSHHKVYMLLDDVVFGGGATVASIYPPFRKNITAGATVFYRDDVLMRSLYDTDVVIGMVFSDGMLQDNGVIKLVEAL